MTGNPLERKQSIDLLGAFLLVSVMLMLGLNQVGVKLVNAGMDPVFQAGLRSLAAAPIIFAIVLYKKVPIDIRQAVLIPGIISGICFAVEFILLFRSVEYTTVARASIFFYTMPFWVAIAAHFMIPGEKLTSKRVIGLILAGAGVVIALSNNETPASEFSLWGDFMALIGAMLWAAIAILTRTTQLSTLKPEMQLLYQLVISTIILIPISLHAGEFFREPTWVHWVIFSSQVIFVICVGFLTWFWVLSVYPASDMASYSFLAPLFGVLFGWLILDEALSWTIIIALILVAAGIVLVNRK